MTHVDAFRVLCTLSKRYLKKSITWLLIQQGCTPEVLSRYYILQLQDSHNWMPLSFLTSLTLSCLETNETTKKDIPNNVGWKWNCYHNNRGPHLASEDGASLKKGHQLATNHVVVHCLWFSKFVLDHSFNHPVHPDLQVHRWKTTRTPINTRLGHQGVPNPQHHPEHHQCDLPLHWAPEWKRRTNGGQCPFLSGGQHRQGGSCYCASSSPG